MTKYENDASVDISQSALELLELELEILHDNEQYANRWEPETGDGEYLPTATCPSCDVVDMLESEEGGLICPADGYTI